MPGCDEAPSGLSRRAALGAAGLLAGWAFAPRFAQAAGGRDARFLTVVLRGGLDGLAAVPPIGDPGYFALRGPLAAPADGPDAARPLDGFFGLHPAMPALRRLYARGEALIVHAAATPYRDRSHFDGQDVLESGQPGPGARDSGWLNRLAGALPAGEAVARRGLLGVGAATPLIARGPAPTLGWAPPFPAPTLGADEDLTQRVADLYAALDPALSASLGLALKAEALAGRGAPRRPAGPASPEGMALIAGGAARLMAAPDGPRLAALALEGWDTHAHQGAATGRLARLLGGLDGAIGAIESGLGPLWRDAVVLVVTEFGRTARVNGTAGADHGVGGAAFLVGGAVKGGRVVADWPGLAPAQLHEGRDLRPTTDLRALAKGVAGELFGLSEAVLSSRVFPDSAGAPGLKNLIAG